MVFSDISVPQFLNNSRFHPKRDRERKPTKEWLFGTRMVSLVVQLVVPYTSFAISNF